MTPWVDSTGSLHFRDNVYGLDEPLARELSLNKQRDRAWRQLLGACRRIPASAEASG